MIATVRRESFAAVGESVPQVPLPAREPKLLQVGVTGADGMKPDADAGRRRPVRCDRAGEPVSNIASIPGPPGHPKKVLADNGEVAGLARIDVGVPVTTGAGGRQRCRDFRPPGAEWLGAMAETRADEEGRALCKPRWQTVGPVFGIIGAAPGFGRFPMRGPDRVAGERDPIACNGRRLHGLGTAP